MTILTARSVTATFSLAIIAKLALMFSSFMQLELLRETVITMEAALANDFRQRLVSHSGTVLATASFVVFMVWLFRSKKKVIAAGMADAEYSPGLTVGCFFIPLANLFLPFQAVKELWRASQNPREWKSCSSSQIVGWWWMFWLLSAFVALTGIFVGNLGEGREKLVLATQVVMASTITSIISFVYTILVVRGIAKNSNAMNEKLKSAELSGTDNVATRSEI